MPDFSRPAYASYVQVCRELRLKREWREGDWFYRQEYDVVLDDPYVGCYGCSELDEYHTSEMVWLPTLADWLEMLEKAVVYHLAIAETGSEKNGDKGYVITDLGSDGGCSYDTFGPSNPSYPTREEGVARLWMAVTQTPAAPSPPPAAR